MGYNIENYRRVRAMLEERRVAAIATADARMAEVHRRSPEVAEIDRALASTGMQLFGEATRGGADLAARLQGGLPAVSLLSHPGLITAYINDVEPLNIFAQQLWAQARKNDVFLAISTGGGSENLRRALMAAKVKGVKSFLLTGNRHGICN